ncbi:DNA-3-methyladenine glycosylase family protein [Bacillus sp. NPDC077027]|uniref:DNA-3-methyladenine glycosylase family protein n=1 Tax=Bacillus sp. NPDC077027 TaxID=3390548 RepID=UPI003D03968D
MWEKKCTIEPPYNFDRVLERLSNDPLKAVDMQKREIKVPIRLADGANIASVQAIGTTESPCLLIKGEGPQTLMVAQIERIFGLNHDLRSVTVHFSKTKLASIFEAHIGTPLMLDFNLYHCLMKCIIHQQLNLSFAYELTRRFVQTYGEQKDGVWFDPLPETIAELHPEDLRQLQFSQRKAEYVIDLSKVIVNGELRLDEFEHMSDEEITQRLLPFRGIGPWTVQNVLLNGLGRPNLFPAADIGIQNAIKQHLQLEAKPTKDDMAEMSKEWEPYLSYASLYLWRSIESKIEHI